MRVTAATATAITAAAPRNADLHCHSSVSDGQLSPAELARRARDNGVELWALTDHDEVAGLAEAGQAAREAGMKFITGVEISVTWAGQTVHIVGLNFDPANAALAEGLRATRAGRGERARRMGERLDKLGMPGAYQGALTFAGNPELISRTHFARYLVSAGYCAHAQAAFDKYLHDGGPGYEPMQWATLAQAVAWIRGAGGRAVMAHPGRYKYTALQFAALFDEFIQLGGEGVEVVTGSHTPEDAVKYAGEAKRYGLLASRGSDFHSAQDSRIDLGMLPPLPPGLKPVWHDWL